MMFFHNPLTRPSISGLALGGWAPYIPMNWGMEAVFGTYVGGRLSPVVKAFLLIIILDMKKNKLVGSVAVGQYYTFLSYGFFFGGSVVPWGVMYVDDNGDVCAGTPFQWKTQRRNGPFFRTSYPQFSWAGVELQHP